MAQIMDKKTIICEALKQYGTCSAKQLSAFIKRRFNEDISPASCTGTLRALVSRGLVGKSNCGAGSTMYWLHTATWEAMKEDM